MPLLRGKYSDFRHQIQAGDVIAFSGKNHFSNIVKWATRSTVSHVGIVFETKVSFDESALPGKIVDIMEATTMQRNLDTGICTTGVQRNRMSSKIKYYDGDIWWLPLSDEARSKLDFRKMTNFLMHSEGKEYDSPPEVIRAAVDALDDSHHFKSWTYNDEDFSAFFCSELVAAALEAGGVIDNINASEVTPTDLCRFDIFADNYYQLKGEEKELSNYNIIDPNGFGES
ncbi:MAG: hypothetical protein NE330_08315 [Lentisphaeraceae bacterium]|nr:hypothetical protein [Lentisphaeraceae bacterium]